MRSTFWIAFVVCLGLPGCAAENKTLRFYTGPPRSASAVATVTFSPGIADNRNVRLAYVDGAHADELGNCMHAGCSFELVPGTHNVTFMYMDKMCDAQNANGECIRSTVWYIPPTNADPNAPLVNCLIDQTRTPGAIMGAAGGLLELASQEIQKAEVKGLCKGVPESGMRKLSFEVKAGTYYDCIFSAAGPDLKMRVEQGYDPNGPPVTE